MILAVVVSHPISFEHGKKPRPVFCWSFASPAALGILASIFAACASGTSGERPGMAYVSAGEFVMGRDAEETDDRPRHPVVVRGFFIDRHEVTNAEYERFDPHHRRDRRTPCDECPVTAITWSEATRYCESQRPPQRLPTEAEWEKAAKGGSDREPEPLDRYAWFEANSMPRAQPVMQKLPNAYGLYDLLGNAAEWVADWYDPRYYERRARDDPQGPADGSRRVVRGGSFLLPTANVTTTMRYGYRPESTEFFVGFRCAADSR